MSKRFLGQKVLVTGGVSGIGRAVALGLASEGAEVVVTGLTAGEVESFACEDPLVSARRLDVGCGESISELVGDIERLDVLFNGAGTIRRNGQEFDAADFASVVDVNLNGTMRMCLAVHDALAATKGAIINVASLFSTFGAPHAPAYSASKGGVVQLTKSLAAAWASDGIRVNAVAPGWIKTPFTGPVSGSESRSEDIVRRTPMGRWGLPEDVVGPVLFLASADAAFVTGAVLPVDGGYSVV